VKKQRENAHSEGVCVVFKATEEQGIISKSLVDHNFLFWHEASLINKTPAGE